VKFCVVFLSRYKCKLISSHTRYVKGKLNATFLYSSFSSCLIHFKVCSTNYSIKQSTWGFFFAFFLYDAMQSSERIRIMLTVSCCCHHQGHMWHYVTLCDSMWRYVTLCDAMWQYVTVCDIMWRYVTLCDAMWRYVTVCDVMWRYVTLCDAMWQYVKLCDAMWQYVKLCDAM